MVNRLCEEISAEKSVDERTMCCKPGNWLSFVVLEHLIPPINIINSIYSFSSKIYNGSWFALIVFLLVTNLTFIGFFNGVYYRENGITDFVRDFIPILYLLIPFFLFSNIENSDDLERDNLIKLVCIGLLIISMGYIYQFISGDNFNINAIGVSLILGDSLDNIMQDPSITFGLMYSFGMMVYFSSFHFMLSTIDV